MPRVPIAAQFRRWCRRKRSALLYQRALALMSQQHYLQAIAALSRSLRGAKNPCKIYTLRGKANWMLQAISSALQDFETAIELCPQNAQAYVYRGLVFRQQGDSDRALLDWQTALHHEPSNPEAAFHAGVLHAERQNYQEALAAFNRVIKAAPNWAEAYQHRGEVRFQLGDRYGAVRDWEYAICNDLTLTQVQTYLVQAHRDDDQSFIAEVIQKAMGEQTYQVSVQLQRELLVLNIDRLLGVPINYFTLPDVIREQLIALEPAGVKHFKLIGRVNGQSPPEWMQTYTLYGGLACPTIQWRLVLLALGLFPPMGLLALTYVWQTCEQYKLGHYPAALRASRLAKKWSQFSLFIGGMLGAVALCYWVVLLFSK